MVRSQMIADDRFTFSIISISELPMTLNLCFYCSVLHLREELVYNFEFSIGFSNFMSSLASSTSGPCSVCGRVLPVHRDGNLRIHGPVTNRCAGSGVALVVLQLPLYLSHRVCPYLPIPSVIRLSNFGTSSARMYLLLLQQHISRDAGMCLSLKHASQF